MPPFPFDVISLVQVASEYEMGLENDRCRDDCTGIVLVHRLVYVAVTDSAFSGVVSTLSPLWPYARFLRLDCMCTACAGFDFDDKDSLLSISANRFG